MLTASHPSRVPLLLGAACGFGRPVRRHYVAIADLAFPQGLRGLSLAYNQTDGIGCSHVRLSPQTKLTATEKWIAQCVRKSSATISLSGDGKKQKS